MEVHHSAKSTIFTSQLPLVKWHDFVADTNLGRCDIRQAITQRSQTRIKRRIDEKSTQKLD
jgi:hypothetical protein